MVGLKLALVFYCPLFFAKSDMLDDQGPFPSTIPITFCNDFVATSNGANPMEIGDVGSSNGGLSEMAGPVNGTIISNGVSGIAEGSSSSSSIADNFSNSKSSAGASLSSDVAVESAARYDDQQTVNDASVNFSLSVPQSVTADTSCGFLGSIYDNTFNDSILEPSTLTPESGVQKVVDTTSTSSEGDVQNIVDKTSTSQLKPDSQAAVVEDVVSVSKEGVIESCSEVINTNLSNRDASSSKNSSEMTNANSPECNSPSPKSSCSEASSTSLTDRNAANPSERKPDEVLHRSSDSSQDGSENQPCHAVSGKAACVESNDNLVTPCGAAPENAIEADSHGSTEASVDITDTSEVQSSTTSNKDQSGLQLYFILDYSNNVRCNNLNWHLLGLWLVGSCCMSHLHFFANLLCPVYQTR